MSITMVVLSSMDFLSTTTSPSSAASMASKRDTNFSSPIVAMATSIVPSLVSISVSPQEQTEVV